MQDYEKPLTWGLTLTQMQQLLISLGYSLDGYNNRATIEKNKITLGTLSIQTFYPGDCGVLLVAGANNATKQKLDDIHTIASKCGFSKMFATVVGYKSEVAAPVFKNQDHWKLVASGKSNRSNGSSADYVFVYYNENCEHKGH